MPVGTCLICEVPIPEVLWRLGDRHFCSEEHTRAWLRANRAVSLLASMDREPKDALREYREGQMRESGLGVWDAD